MAEAAVSFPFHILNDKKTEMYVKFAKVVVIYQGPYTNARKCSSEQIKKTYTSASCLISDATFSTDLRCDCTDETTEEYYNYFMAQLKNGVEVGNNLIYIDATMSNLKQNQYYCSVANKCQYVTLIIPPVVTERAIEHPWPRKSQAREFEKFSKRRIEAPNMFQHLFCAWFLHDIDTEELRSECALYCNDLFENLSEFCEWFSKVGDSEKFPKYFGLLPDDVKKEDQVMREDLAFCPVKVFDTEYEMTKYFEKPIVKENYGKMSKLFIVGFIISPHMVAARVQLTYKQRDLWEMNDNIQEDAFINYFPSDLYKESKKLPPPIPDVNRVCSKSNSTIIRGKFVHDPTELILPYHKGRSCNIVLGTAPGASASDIDYGVAFAATRDLKAYKSETYKTDYELYDIGKSQVRRIGKYWFVYLKDTLVVNGFFASCCKPLAFDTPLELSKKIHERK